MTFATKTRLRTHPILVVKALMLLAALLILQNFTAARAQAQAAPKVAPSCGPYRVAYYEYGSLYFQTMAGTYQGIDKDVMNELARRTGCKFNTFLDSRVRTWTDLAAGNLDMTVSGIKTPEREQYAIFVPYLKSRNLLLVRDDLNPPVHSIADFVQNDKLRLAVVKSFQHGGEMDGLVAALKAQGRVDEYADAQTTARVVSLGRAQAFLAEPVAWQPLIEKNALERKLVYLEDTKGESYIAGLVLSKNRVKAADVQKMKLAIDAMRDDGTLLKIYRNYVALEIAAKVIP